jgi:hypothetical protein
LQCAQFCLLPTILDCAQDHWQKRNEAVCGLCSSHCQRKNAKAGSAACLSAKWAQTIPLWNSDLAPLQRKAAETIEFLAWGVWRREMGSGVFSSGETAPMIRCTTGQARLRIPQLHCVCHE